MPWDDPVTNAARPSRENAFVMQLQIIAEIGAVTYTHLDVYKRKVGGVPTGEVGVLVIERDGG